MAQRTIDEVIETLESLVDSRNLASVVEGLATVCALKAQHLRENWQDHSSAKVWERFAKKLDTLESDIAKYSI